MPKMRRRTLPKELSNSTRCEGVHYQYIKQSEQFDVVISTHSAKILSAKSTTFRTTTELPARSSATIHSV